MESFRVRNAAPDHQRKLLLALSFGVSSVTLLHILDHQLKTQKTKTGRTGFALHVVFIEIPGTKSSLSAEEAVRRAQELYPDHQYASLPLHDIFCLVPDSTLSDLVQDLSTVKDVSHAERLAHLINSLGSATARTDVLTTLTIRLVVEYARSTGCESILWGDSTTKLAEKTLSETAKGRGYSLPWRIADGESPFGVAFHYPLRDVLKKELVSYVEHCESSLSSLVFDSQTNTPASMSSKNTTIDDLMKQYFESVEDNFPSIVSNVVRTTSKLDAPSNIASAPRCHLCGMPVSDGRFGIHQWGGDQHDGFVPMLPEDGPRLCYGCTRSIPRMPGSLGSG